jgi:protein TonB
VPEVPFVPDAVSNVEEGTMFDTSVVKAAPAQGRYGLLTASVILHSAIVAAALAASVTSTRFPADAPDQITMFRPVDPPVIPPPLGQPDAPPRPNRGTPPPQQPRQQAAPQPDAAPQQIPDATPVLEPGPSTVESPVAGSSAEPGPGGPGYGSPTGTEGGIGKVEPVQQPLNPGGDVLAARVITRVSPRYPSAMLGVRLREVTVTVHCIIGKDGTIRDPQIVRSSFAPFNDSVLEAVRQWTFAPGTRRGQPVDTYFELTVRFQVR